ncbi:uncharacterized protein METZ01_LOCUS248893, partial [marine metagenome]
MGANAAKPISSALKCGLLAVWENGHTVRRWMDLCFDRIACVPRPGCRAWLLTVVFGLAGI